MWIAANKGKMSDERQLSGVQHVPPVRMPKFFELIILNKHHQITCNLLYPVLNVINVFDVVMSNSHKSQQNFDGSKSLINYLLC